MNRQFIIVSLLFFLSGCASIPHENITVSNPVLWSHYSAYDVVREAEKVIIKTDKENSIVVVVDRESLPIKAELIGLGTRNRVLIDPYEVFRPVVDYKGYGVVILHTHPGGTLKPSEDDLRIKDRMIKAGNILRLPLVDDIIIGEGDYYSMREEGEL